MGKRKAKTRTDFRKNRTTKTRQTNWTREYESHRFENEAPLAEERISGKGELTRQRTIRGELLEESEEPGFRVRLEVDERVCLSGRVLAVRGLNSRVQAEDGRLFNCVTRRLLRTLATDQRHVIAVGDCVLFRPVSRQDEQFREGIIERVEPRHGSLCRTSRGRRHVLVTNVDQVLIITSAAEPHLKPNLIDRLLVTCEKVRIPPVICINKVDLVDPGELQPLVGGYAQMGYQVLLTSAAAGFGIERFKRLLHGRESVLAGQSGVGKSSLLNAVDPSLHLATKSVSYDTQKGRHTTTTAQLLPLSSGGFVVDTPGVRQFALWDVIPEEVAGFFRDLRPYVSLCRFPNCTHIHETGCAVKDAVADGRLDERRYESYRHLFLGDSA